MLKLEQVGALPASEKPNGTKQEILVTFAPDAERSLFDLTRMSVQLKELCGSDVGIVTRRGIESSRNPFRIREVLHSLEMIYES